MLQLFPTSQDQDQDHEFDWKNDSENVVITEQPAVAIFENTSGYLVIRQKAGKGEDHDAIIVIKPELANALAKKIICVANEMIGGQ